MYSISDENGSMFFALHIFLIWKWMAGSVYFFSLGTILKQNSVTVLVPLYLRDKCFSY